MAAFEAFLNQGQGTGRRRRWRAVTLVGSLVLHGALIVFAVARSFWQVDEVQPLRVHISLVSMPAAPPPPAAAAVKAEMPRPAQSPKRRPVAQRTQPTSQPRVVQAAPPEPAEEAPAAASEHPSEAGGVPGGVPGGVAAVMLAAALPTTPPKEPSPVMLPPSVGGGQRTSDLSDPRFRPSLPAAMKQAGVTLWGLFRVCVDSQGQVTDVKVLKSADAMVDGAWSSVIRRWSYRPYMLAGRPVPFCHAARIEVRADGT